MNTENPVVIDLGSESVKAGYASHVPSEQEPRIIVPSLVTVRPRAGSAQAAGGANVARTARVVERGNITRTEILDAMLHHLLYDQLGWVKGEEGAVLFVEPLFVGKVEREVLTQLMFEGYNVAGLFLHDAAALSLFAAGKLTGCSVDIGHGKVDIATVSEGVMHAPGAVRMSFAGEQLTKALGHVLTQQQPGLQRLSQQQLGALKVQCCQAAPSHRAFQHMMAAPPPPLSLDEQQQRQQQAAAAAAAAAGGGGGGSTADTQPSANGVTDDPPQLPPLPLGTPQEYTLPDGTRITVGVEGVCTGEALLRPRPELGLPYAPGLVDCILECIDELPDASARRGALDGVLLCGGGACMAGLGERVEHELRAQLPDSLHPKMTALPEYMCMPTPQYAPWVGGAVMAKLAAYQSHFMIKAEYEECGPYAVHRKCA